MSDAYANSIRILKHAAERGLLTSQKQQASEGPFTMLSNLFLTTASYLASPTTEQVKQQQYSTSFVTPKRMKDEDDTASTTSSVANVEQEEEEDDHAETFSQVLKDLQNKFVLRRQRFRNSSSSTSSGRIKRFRGMDNDFIAPARPMF